MAPPANLFNREAQLGEAIDEIRLVVAGDDDLTVSITYWIGGMLCVQVVRFETDTTSLKSMYLSWFINVKNSCKQAWSAK